MLPGPPSTSSTNTPGSRGVRYATLFSTGSGALHVSRNRPPIPARPRRWLSASIQPLFDCTHDSDWSCTAAVIRCPSRLLADAVTGSISPPPGRLIRVRPVSGMKFSPSGPSSIIGCNARQVLSV
jgi:hypothetical protein